MALMICPECGKQVSNMAIQCPNCGYPIRQQSSPQPSCPLPPVYMPPMYAQPPLSSAYGSPKIPGRGFAIAGLALGIIGTVFTPAALLTVCSMFGVFYDDLEWIDVLALPVEIAIFGILALVFGLIARKRGDKSGQSTAAIALSCLPIISLIVSIVFFVMRCLVFYA